MTISIPTAQETQSSEAGRFLSYKEFILMAQHARRHFSLLEKNHMHNFL